MWKEIYSRHCLLLNQLRQEDFFMKTTIAALAVILSAGSLLAGEKIEINGGFKQLDPEKTAPVGWIQNHKNKPGIGTVKIVPASEKDENALQITTSKLHTPFYTKKAYPVKPGDTIKMKANVKGKGSADLIVYLYDKTGVVAAEKFVRGKAVPNKFTTFKGSYTVDSTYTVKRKGETVEAVPTTVRFVFSVVPKSEIVIENIEAEIEPAK